MEISLRPHLVQTHLALYTLPQSSRVPMCFNHVDLGAHLPLVSFISYGSYTLFISLLQDSLSPEERKLMETFHLGLSVPRSLTLCVLSSYGSLYLFSSAAEGSVSDNG